MPTALGKERFRVAHLEDVANSAALVYRMLIVGLHDAITDPVSQIAGFLECSIEEPVRKIGLILVGNEGRLYLTLAPLCFSPDAGVSDAARDHLAHELGCALDERDFEHGRMFVPSKGLRLLNVDVFVRDHMHKPILDVRIEVLHTAERLHPYHHTISWSPRSHWPAAANCDSYSGKLGARI